MIFGFEFAILELAVGPFEALGGIETDIAAALSGGSSLILRFRPSSLSGGSAGLRGFCGGNRRSRRPMTHMPSPEGSHRIWSKASFGNHAWVMFFESVRWLSAGLYS